MTRDELIALGYNADLIDAMFLPKNMTREEYNRCNCERCGRRSPVRGIASQDSHA